MRAVLATSRRARLGRSALSSRFTSETGPRDLTRALAHEPELIAALVGPSSGHGGSAPTAVREVLLEAVTRCPGYADLHYYCARALMQIDENEQAEALLDRALKLNPDYIDALVLRGRLACRLEKNRAGVADLTRAVELGANYADVHKLLGDLQRRLGQAKSAGASYERALRINASFTAARIALSELNGRRAAL